MAGMPPAYWRSAPPDHYEQLAARLERLAYELRQRSEANVIDLLEAAQFIRDVIAQEAER